MLEDGQQAEPDYRTETMCYEGGIRSFLPTWAKSASWTCCTPM